MNDVHLRRFVRADTDWLVARHRALYAQAEGFDASFGVLVGEILSDFNAEHDPECERGWIAQTGDTRLGSIFCVRLDAETAKLRLFQLEPQARGSGLGKRMLTHCTEFARLAGYRRMRLWTHESHRAACRLYAADGWALQSSRAVRSFGRDNVEQEWSRVL